MPESICIRSKHIFVVYIYIFLFDLDLALQPRNEHVKLHVTLMNTGFYDYQQSVNGDSTKKSHLTFDARKIIEVSIVTVLSETNNSYEKSRFFMSSSYLYLMFR